MTSPQCKRRPSADLERGRDWRRLGRESAGFTLIEVLVVVLIVGIVSAIVIVSLLGTSNKASDAQAKTLVRNAETTAEAIGSEQGSYGSISLATLASEEPALVTAVSTEHAYLSKASGGEQEFSLTAKAPNGDELTISKDAEGSVTRTCSSPILKNGCSGEEHSNW